MVIAYQQDASEIKLGSKLQQRQSEFKKPALIEFHGPIDTKRTKYFRNRIARVKASGADLVVIDIDSPGGLAFESVEIAETLRDVDWAYTVAFIPREAISGAAIIAFGCDEIVMGDQARIGDIGVIQFDYQLFAFRYAPAKAISMLSRQAQDLAIAKGRPKELAEAMVDKDVVVFQNKAAAQTKLQFKTVRLENENQNPIEAAKKSGLDTNQWVLIEESGPQRFLTVNGPTAVNLGIASFNAASLQDVSRQLNVTGSFTKYRYKMKDDFVYWLNTWIVTALLIIIGLIALYVELSAPGIGAGGLIAGLCAALFFWSRFLGGTSTWLEVILFMAGIIFLLMEIFVIPGWGVSGFTGLLLIFVSVVLAGQEFVIPETERQWSQLLTSMLVFFCSACVVLIAAGFITKRLGSIPIFNRLVLSPQLATADGDDVTDVKSGAKPSLPVHPEVSVGDWGVAESLLRPAGRVRFGNASVDVVSDGAFIEPETQVRVTEISGNRIVVAEIEDTDETVYKSQNS